MESLTGKELGKLRESKGITLDEAAKATCLRVSIIKAIENDEPCDLLSPLYLNFSRRTYARYLDNAAQKEAAAAKASPGVSAKSSAPSARTAK